MLYLDDIKVEIESQGFWSEHMGISPQKDKAVLFMRSTKKTKDVRCCACGSEVYLHDDAQTHLTDMPLWHGIKQRVLIQHYRYRCKKCNKTFVEEIPFKYPGTRITLQSGSLDQGNAARKNLNQGNSKADRNPLGYDS